jgi:hypothetical protein
MHACCTPPGTPRVAMALADVDPACGPAARATMPCRQPAAQPPAPLGSVALAAWHGSAWADTRADHLSAAATLSTTTITTACLAVSHWLCCMRGCLTYRQLHCTAWALLRPAVPVLHCTATSLCQASGTCSFVITLQYKPMPLPRNGPSALPCKQPPCKHVVAVVLSRQQARMARRGCAALYRNESLPG